MRKIEKGYAYNKDGAADTIFPDLNISICSSIQIQEYVLSQLLGQIKVVKLFKIKYMFSL